MPAPEIQRFGGGRTECEACVVFAAELGIRIVLKTEIEADPRTGFRTPPARKELRRSDWVRFIIGYRPEESHQGAVAIPGNRHPWGVEQARAIKPHKSSQTPARRMKFRLAPAKDRVCRQMMATRSSVIGIPIQRIMRQQSSSRRQDHGNRHQVKHHSRK